LIDFIAVTAFHKNSEMEGCDGANGKKKLKLNKWKWHFKASKVEK